MDLFSSHGVPREILTDQATNFMLELLQELHKLLGIKSIRTSPYHPQTDGLVERFNQTLKHVMKKVLMTDCRNWDKLLPQYQSFPSLLVLLLQLSCMLVVVSMALTYGPTLICSYLVLYQCCTSW